MKILIPNSLWYANFVIELCISINALRSIQFSLYEKYVNNNFIFRNKISMIPNMSCFKIGIPTISRYFLEVFQTISYFNLQYCRITINSHCLGTPPSSPSQLICLGENTSPFIKLSLCKTNAIIVKLALNTAELVMIKIYSIEGNSE